MESYRTGKNNKIIHGLPGTCKDPKVAIPTFNSFYIENLNLSQEWIDHENIRHEPFDSLGGGGGGIGGINDMIWQLVLEKFNMIPFCVQFHSRFRVVLSFVPLSEGSFGA